VGGRGGEEASVKGHANRARLNQVNSDRTPADSCNTKKRVHPRRSPSAAEPRTSPRPSLGLVGEHTEEADAGGAVDHLASPGR